MLTIAEYVIFKRLWHQELKSSLRLGQAFWNKYLSHETQLEDRLFYIEGEVNAEKIIYKYYIKETKHEDQ